MRNSRLGRIAAVAALALLWALVPFSGATAVNSKCVQLTAGQTMPAGEVCVTQVDADTIQVVFTTDTGWLMTEAHLDVEDSAGDFPVKNGNPIPGQFDFAYVDPNGFTSHAFTVDGLTVGPYLIAAHAKVWAVGAGAGTISLPLVSDTTVQVTAFNGVAEGPSSAVAAYEPVGYQNCGSYLVSPATGSVWDTQNGGSASNDAGGPFDGALWIWRTANPALPDAGEYVTFEKTVDLLGPPAGGSIKITADNGYQLFLNGTKLGEAQIGPFFPASLKEAPNPYGVNTTGWQTPETYNLPVVSGLNTLSIIAANEYAYPDDVPNLHTTGIGGVPGGICPNPGALIFKATASYYTDSDTGWGAYGTPDANNFGGSRWASYFQFTLV